MTPKFKEKLFFKTGNIKDIISVIEYADKRGKKDTKDLVQQMQFQPTKEGMRRIRSYVRNNIRYKKDPKGHERIKSPARTLAEKTGDCKSMSVLVASILQNMKQQGVRYFYRAVLFTDRYGHIYVIAVLPDGEKVIVDPVFDTFNAYDNRIIKGYDIYPDGEQKEFSSLAGKRQKNGGSLLKNIGLFVFGFVIGKKMGE